MAGTLVRALPSEEGTNENSIWLAFAPFQYAVLNIRFFFSFFLSASVTTAGALECPHVTVAKSGGQFAPRNMAFVPEDTYH